MRIPTPASSYLAWWRAAIAGDQPQITSEPHVGFFKRKLVRGGVFVPCEIRMVQEVCPETGELIADEYLDCLVNGIRHDPHEEWLWLCANPITEAEFKYLTGLRDWAAWHSPNDPAANPTRRLDPLSTPIPF